MNSRIYPVEELQGIVNKAIVSRLSKLENRMPDTLYAPVIYSMGVGGKRIRPVLLLMAYNLFSGSITDALPAALSLEFFHNFTLLHDDIMDKAPVRRNKPTVHVRYSENSAILSGDAMAFLSYRYLLESASDRMMEVLQLFTETALEVCEGQQYDMDFEQSDTVTEPEYLKMIRLKTAVLLGCSLKAGALLAGAHDNDCQALYDFGIHLGMGFQLQDDWLDSFGNQELFGKKIGGDIVANKKTYLLIKAIERANIDQKAALTSWLNAENFNLEEKIESVLQIYNQLGINEATIAQIDHYFNQARIILDDLSVDESRKGPLKELAGNMMRRSV
jgi:geranylgeranyl diphosphate synthase type II